MGALVLDVPLEEARANAYDVMKHSVLPIHTPSVLSILALHISTVTNRNQMWKKELDGEKNGVEHKWIK